MHSRRIGPISRWVYPFCQGDGSITDARGGTPIDRIEAEPLRRGALQDNDMLTQGQVLGFE
jgi:hypothetical protein